MTRRQNYRENKFILHVKTFILTIMYLRLTPLYECLTLKFKAPIRC